MTKTSVESIIRYLPLIEYFWMLSRVQFMKMTTESQSDWVSNFLDEFKDFKNPNIKNLVYFRNLLWKNSFSSAILVNIFDIIHLWHQKYLQSAFLDISNYISKIKEQEAKDNLNNNPDDLLNNIDV